MDNELKESLKWYLCTDEPSEESGPDIWVCILLTCVQAESKFPLLAAAVRSVLPRSGFSLRFQMTSEAEPSRLYLSFPVLCVCSHYLCVDSLPRGCIFFSLSYVMLFGNEFRCLHACCQEALLSRPVCVLSFPRASAFLVLAITYRSPFVSEKLTWSNSPSLFVSSFLV